MILVTGATGLIGRHVVRRLMTAGYPVRCLIPEQRENLPWDTLPEIITGNLMNEEVLFRAMNGVYTIIHLENAQWWGRPRDLERMEIVGTRNLIAAARSARVGRIIIVSHLGAAVSSAFDLLRVKGIVEEMLRGSGLAYTIIRSGLVFGPQDVFVNHIAMMMRVTPLIFLMPGQGEVILHPIHIDDLTEIIVRSLETVDVVDETVEVGGPEYLTFGDMLATIMRVTRLGRLVVGVPPYLMRFITRFYGIIFRRTLMTQQWLDILAANRTARLGNAYNYFGIHPRRFEDTLLTYLPHKPLFWPTIRYVFRRRPRGV